MCAAAPACDLHPNACEWIAAADMSAPVRGVIEDAPVPDDHLTRAEENAMQDAYDARVEGWAS